MESGLSKAILISLVAHIFIAVLFVNYQTSPIKTTSSKVQHIHSYIYNPPRPEKPLTSENLSTLSTEQKTVVSTINKVDPKHILEMTPPTMANAESKGSPAPKSTAVKQNKTVKTDPPIRRSPKETESTNTFVNKELNNLKTVKRQSSYQSLSQLKNNIAESVLNESREEYIKEWLAQKNKITKSVASSKEQPEAPINKIECSGMISNGMAFISATLGGTIKCKNPPDIDKFIDERLKNRGIKKD